MSAEKQCPFCALEARDLFALAHNVFNAWRLSSDERFHRKMMELKDAVERYQPLVDAHFESCPGRAPAISSETVERLRAYFQRESDLGEAYEAADTLLRALAAELGVSLTP